MKLFTILEPKAQWVHPRFLLTFDNDVRPHVIQVHTIMQQAFEFTKLRPKILRSLQGVIHSNGKVFLLLMDMTLQFFSFILIQAILQDDAETDHDEEDLTDEGEAHIDHVPNRSKARKRQGSLALFVQRALCFCIAGQFNQHVPSSKPRAMRVAQGPQMTRNESILRRLTDEAEANEEIEQEDQKQSGDTVARYPL